ncbi:hypothetical protein [Pseudarthrobacter sulfonivorans]|uniref:hypothetical protein n=1 Tax=Pseudarthrobacter sulfonivorans TaxID=121292 RepID=UPI00168BD572|nr:hypothetical protein [Pseudarthrobacter sulfonivorans]
MANVQKANLDAARAARHEKSHAPAASAFGICIGTIGAAIIALVLKNAKANCFTLLGPPKTDTWCVTVKAIDANDITYWIIGAILGAVVYGLVYLYYYYVD